MHLNNLLTFCSSRALLTFYDSRVIIDEAYEKYAAIRLKQLEVMMQLLLELQLVFSWVQYNSSCDLKDSYTWYYNGQMFPVFPSPSYSMLHVYAQNQLSIVTSGV